MSLYNCPPTYLRLPPLPSDATLLDYAARASMAANRFQTAMDARTAYPVCVRLGAELARATQALSTAIADSVACGSDSLTE
jgi:hypothetical protein